IQPGSVEQVYFTTLQGKSTIKLDRKDDFLVDNTAYLSNPYKSKTDILIITNLDENNYVKAAMEASPHLNVEVRQPPTINPENLNHDVVIVNEINGELLVPGDFDLISRHVKKGSSIVIMGQKDLPAIDLSDLMPVTLGDLKEKDLICIQVINRFTKHLSGSECFTRSPYFELGNTNDTTVLAKTDDGEPVFVLNNHDDGKVFYYGVFDNESDFKGTSEYPIFWSELIGFLSNAEDLLNFNVKSGDLQSIPEQLLKTPSESITTSTIKFDETGFYSYSDKIIASNLINEKESNVGKTNILKSDTGILLEAGEEDTERDLNLDIFIIVFIGLLLLLELIILKRRGEA
ncbi:hypothetical protein ACFLZX_01570, partial [Nanoarchaeota archaeon]